MSNEDAQSDVSSVLSDADDLKELQNVATKATSLQSPPNTNRANDPTQLKANPQTTHARIDARKETQHETPRAAIPRAPPAKAKTPLKPQLTSAIELWRADCGICEEDAPDAWNALDSAERERFEARDAKRKAVRFADGDGSADRKARKKRAKLVPIVAGIPVLSAASTVRVDSTDPVPRVHTTSTIKKKVSFSGRSREGKSRFVAKLMASGWSVSSAGLRKTYWSPGRPPIAFDSLTQIANAFPDLVPDA